MYQLPPTPTPLPDNLNPPIEMPPLTLWDYTDVTIQTWNSASEITTIFQAVFLIGMVMFIAIAIYQRIQKTTGNNDV